ncbi:MAG: penicillin acylase [Lysobacterales bacterium]|nr:MAG: penicillin acylase [Xanthomonadales bacterium]
MKPLPIMAKLVRRSLAALLALVLAFIIYVGYHLERSQPRLEGALSLASLTAPVAVERDALGVVSIRATNRLDAIRALGFVHAQERFFEMDLMRRAAAGELAELLGRQLLPIDRARRPHRFRERARRALSALPPAQLAWLEAYADGVREGLADLGASPFPHRLLFLPFRSWTPEDSLLVVYAMYFDLQGRESAYDLSRLRLRRALPDAVHAFLTAPAADWETPLAGEPPAPPPPPIPDPALIDLRSLPSALWPERPEIGSGDFAPGSNAWAVAGTRTNDGRALLANDMHLGLRVPNIWFRVRMVYPGVDAVGVSLPGVPGIVVGSNGHLAWGFTNAYGDFQQWIAVPAERRREHEEILAVRSAGEERLRFEESDFGPVLERLADGTALALAWTAHQPGAADLGLFELIEARSIEEALAVAARAGMPAQNMLIASADGRIAWTIAGRLPRRNGPAEALLSHDDPRAVWQGWLEPEEQPRRLDPPDGVLWSANARMVSGADGEKIGDGGLVLGARARQIRDALFSLREADERAMLAIQLDDRALFLGRWQRLLLAALAGMEGENARKMRELVLASSERAAPEAVGYRLVRDFRSEIHRRIAAGVIAAVRRHDPEFSALHLPHFEGVVWRLLEERPMHWLDPRFADWEGFLRDAAGTVLSRALEAPGGLEGYRWGDRNRVAVRHPLSQGLPWLSRWLDPPTEPLAGDLHMPRVQGPVFGASERLAVRPGGEREGIFHMPGGQSGHPRSPFYLAGHRDWLKGAPTPFLPGPARYRLALELVRSEPSDLP